MYSQNLTDCAVEIKLKAGFENGCGPSKGARSRGIKVGKGAMPLAPCGVTAMQDAVTKVYWCVKECGTSKGIKK